MKQNSHIVFFKKKTSATQYLEMNPPGPLINIHVIINLTWNRALFVQAIYMIYYDLLLKRQLVIEINNYSWTPSPTSPCGQHSLLIRLNIFLYIMQGEGKWVRISVSIRERKNDWMLVCNQVYIRDYYWKAKSLLWCLINNFSNTPCVFNIGRCTCLILFIWYYMTFSNSRFFLKYIINIRLVSDNTF